jgi:Mrp family chromosome partitioning ATPase
MTIQEALEKAKQLSRERQMYAGETVARTANGRASAHMRRRDPETPALLRKFDAARLAYDRRICIRNRIMMPDDSMPAATNAAAAYRMVRARVLQRLRANNWTSLAVTSPGPGDGKSITAINMAISIAREKNNNVFLLDLDMRNPTLCSSLGIEPRDELVRYFTGEARIEDVFFSIGLENLTLAGSLGSSEQSSELLSTTKLPELFEFIRSSATSPLIIVDLPPVLSTDDVLVVAPHVDALMLIVAEGKTRRDGLERTLEVLQEFTVAGIVLNQSREAVTDYYGSRSYGSRST